MRKVIGVVCGVALAALLTLAATSTVEARPQYQKAFLAQYPDVTEAKKVKCGVCHPEKSKKVRNAYGKAVGEGVGEKNQKDEAKIKEALAKAEAKKGEGDQTFGEQLKAGKLPK